MYQMTADRLVTVWGAQDVSNDCRQACFMQHCRSQCHWKAELRVFGAIAKRVGMATCQPHGLIPIRRTQSRKIEHTLPFVLYFNVITPRRHLEDDDTVEQHGQQMRTAFFWVITQAVVAIPYRRFGTTYRSDP